MFELPKEPSSRLRGTSQGKRTDFPPEDWIHGELARLGAVNTGKKWTSNLTGELHPFFDKKHWPDIAPERFQVLEQTFQLATRLLKVAGPYICNFLPDPQFHGKWLKRLEVNDTRSTQKIETANVVLLEIVDHIQWRESPYITVRNNWYGLNHVDTTIADEDIYGSHYSNMEGWDRAARQAKRAGLRHRQFTISITSRFVDSLLAVEKGSHEYMVAAFAAAITIVHELGHTIFLHDLR